MPKGKAGALMEGSVRSALRKMAVPMATGMIFMILVNVIDTFWVARLGTEPLAAMTFTFPVIGLVINLALGIMIGTSTAVARAIGGGETEQAARLTTHALMLAVGFVILLSGAGLLFQDALFLALGASPELLPLIRAYMTIWFVGVVFLIIPIVANGSLRAMGDAKTPMKVMILAAAINAVLDPLLIFGWGPIPALGLQGAAIATLIARFLGMLYTLWTLLTKTTLVQPRLAFCPTFFRSVRQVLSVGVPAAITNALGPVAVGILTAIVAQFGSEALAAYGIGARVDAMVLIAPSALAAALSPFIGQNWGAHLSKRVAEGIRTCLHFSLGWGVVSAVLIFLSAPWIAGVFTEDLAVQQSLVVYLRAVPVGYAFLACASVASSAFNAVDRAVRSTWLSLLRSLILAVPAAWIGSQIDGLRGVFLGLVIASVLASLAGVRWLATLLNPDGQATPDMGPELGLESLESLKLDPPHRALLRELLPPVMELEGMTLRRVRGGQLGFYIGRRELAHLTPAGRLDIPLPMEVGQNLVNRGVVDFHPSHENNSWFVHPMESEEQVQQGVWLLRMGHLLYMLSQRGSGDPVTQSELSGFVISQACIDALTAAAVRWDLRVEEAA